MSKVPTTVRSGAGGAFEREANCSASDVTIIISNSGLKNSSVSDHAHAKKVVGSIKSLWKNPDCLTGICEEGETIWENTF